MVYQHDNEKDKKDLPGVEPYVRCTTRGSLTYREVKVGRQWANVPTAVEIMCFRGVVLLLSIWSV
jgi:hypothetical protein